MSPASMPSISNGTTSPSKTQRMRCSGRTQRSVPEPQVIDFGHGKPRTISSTISATISAVGRPACADGGEPDAVASRPAGPGRGRSSAGSPRSPGRARRRGDPCAPRAGRPAPPAAPRPPASGAAARRSVVSASGSRPSAASRSRAIRSRSRAAPRLHARRDLFGETVRAGAGASATVPRPGVPALFGDPGLGALLQRSRMRPM